MNNFKNDTIFLAFFMVSFSSCTFFKFFHQPFSHKNKAFDTIFLAVLIILQSDVQNHAFLIPFYTPLFYKKIFCNPKLHLRIFEIREFQKNTTIFLAVFESIKKL